MTTIGLCTRFSQTDQWAFKYALDLVKAHNWRLIICHWLYSPFTLRRDMIQDDLFNPKEIVPTSPKLINKLEFQLRQHYDPLLGDFTDVAFKLCEGFYQVEMVRCLRQHMLDLVVMGYQSPEAEVEAAAVPLEEFAMRLDFPVVIIGKEGPETFLLNQKAFTWLDRLGLPDDSWQILKPVSVAG